ncbi:MAG TPA: guanylate kinase [Actinomycetota bacterium]|nr:guanylate kinase [Actinomycetota bacterium]
MIAGPSGVGKGTVVRRVLETVPDLELSVSVTTRRRRPSERDGVDYRFVDEGEFDRLIEAGELLEWAEVFDARYGTPAGPIRGALEQGRDALLEIDVQGARQVREAMPGAVMIFLVPPSLQELERRLRTRGTEDEERLARRLATASRELEARDWFDHEVVNDELERASSQVAAIIEATRGSSHRLQRAGSDGRRTDRGSQSTPAQDAAEDAEGNPHP